jgi:uncharacterized protein (TIGR03067 family)
MYRPLLLAVVALVAIPPAYAQAPSAAAGQGAKAAAVATELKALAGEWKCVTWVIDGKPTPKEELDKEAPVVMKGNTMVGMENGKVVYEGVYDIDPTRTPRTIDLRVTVGPDAGKQSLAIYEIDGDTWRTCWTLYDVKRDRPTTFTSEPGSGLILAVYQRVKK